MSRPEPPYSLSAVNHQTGGQIKIELVDLPFPGARTYRLRVNDKWAQNLPVVSRTIVLKQLRAWLVKH
jgi:hypothetical protein